MVACVPVIAAIVGCLSGVRAQIPPIDPASGGTSYIIAFPDTVTNLFDARFTNPLADGLTLLVYSPVENDITVHGLHYDKTVHAAAGNFAVIELQTSDIGLDTPFVWQVGAISNNTFRVEARSPVILYCWVMTDFGGEMWTPIPVDRWGKEYYVAATVGEVVADADQDQKLVYVWRNKMGSANFMVIAGHDQTNVSVYPTGSLLKAPIKVMLNAGQTYQWQSVVDTIASHAGVQQSDIGGTLIQADHPIGVISGNTRAQVLPELTTVTGNSLKNMGYEWLSPSEQFGTQFAYVPTWDTRHLTGARNEKVAEKRSYEMIRIYGASSASSKIFTQKDSTHYDTTTTSSTRVKDYKVIANRGWIVRSEKPAQVMMHSSAVVRYNGTISGTAGSGSYDTWGAYECEITPREQWTNFAPYYAPTYPYETLHYINVVADTNAFDLVFDENGSPFEFNMGQIPGTGLMWGTMQFQPGQAHWLEGREGSRFAAYVYGTRPGLERYIPKTAQGSAQYQEVIALSYGYPAAPLRKVLRAGDSLQIDTSRSLCSFHIQVHALGANPLGLRAAWLDSAVNARLINVAPLTPDGLVGIATATFDVDPINGGANASATFVVEDRAGKQTRIRYTYAGERVTYNAGVVFDLGEINVNETRDTVVTITNTLTRAVEVKRLRLASGAQAMTIVASDPAVPATLQPGAHMSVTVRGAPVSKNRVYLDTLRLTLGCAESALPLRVGSVAPCIQVGDLDFGDMRKEQVRTLYLRICNAGGGTVRLANASGDSVITWLLENFRIAADDLARLRNTTLVAGQCVEVPVTFSSGTSGMFVVTARIWASTRDCRDTSIWRANVVPTGGVEAVAGNASSGITYAMPNPASGLTIIGYHLAAPGRALVEVYDLVGRRVALLADRAASAGDHTVMWNADAVTAGVYYCRLSVGGLLSTRMIVVQ